MTALIWAWAFLYVGGHLLLWHLVERERRPLPDDHLGDPEPITIMRPPPERLTSLGWRRWRLARRFTVIGLLGWAALVVGWITSSLARR